MSVLLISTCAFSGSAYAQEGENSESEFDKQREEELLKAIDEQKKALSEQRKAQVNAQKEMEKSIRELEKLRDFDYDFDLDEFGNNVHIYRRGKSVNPDVFVVPPVAPGAPLVPDVNSVFIGTPSFGWDNNNGTSWIFTKSVKDNSFKKEYAFDVDETAKTVTMAISGDCKAGDIRIKVMTPQGKTYSDVVIDEFGNINVRKSFNISESENKDKRGEWKFLINSNSATGYFKISFQTY